MTVTSTLGITVALALGVSAPAAQHTGHQHQAGHERQAGHHPQQHDRHHGIDARGHLAMGFDQAKITHTFAHDDAGGEIEIKAKDAADAVTIAQIQAHVKEIEKAFAGGDFSKPFFIHDEKVPGAEAMAREKDALEYRAENLTDGARLVIVAKTQAAKDAVHAFMRYQHREHGK